MQHQLTRQAGKACSPASQQHSAPCLSAALTPAAHAPRIASSHSRSSRRRGATLVRAEPVKEAAAAPVKEQEPAPMPAAAPAAPAQPKEWYAVVASSEFFFNDPQNESLAEQLRERVRYFKEIKREVDFFLVPEPKWLDAKYPEQAKAIKRPCVALMSTDKTWIVFMKLRLDRVMRFDMGPVSDAEALAVGGTVPEFKAPEKWTAPYPGYTPGWWNVFLPKA